jgi:hypothetical protein
METIEDQVYTLLEGSRVYLSGPMDFVGSRIIEKYMGWRSILTPIMHALRVSVLDPWNKPLIRGLDPDNKYGREGVNRPKDEYTGDFWTNPLTRAQYETDFWETVHIDLRMTDISDFTIAFVPTNIYSVGTVHEIITARMQKKPTLLVSPPISYDLFPALQRLSEEERRQLKFYGLKENPHGLPSQWYGYIVGGHYLYDGFGWENISLRSDTFYEDLIQEVLEQAHRNQEADQYEEVRAWVEEYTPLQHLTGSVLDHVQFEEGEEQQFMEAYHSDQEQRHHYYWYNKPYSPKRPLLYQLFSIAAGVIPPKIQFNTSLDKEGKKVHNPVKVQDDSWLLATIAEQSDTRRDTKNRSLTEWYE